MVTPKPHTAVLQGVAADPISKAGTEMKQAEPPLAEPRVSAVKPAKAGHVDDKGPESR